MLIILFFLISCVDSPDTNNPVTYTVVFESNGGSAVADQVVVAGGLITEPASPLLAGYSIGGWFSDSILSKKWDFAADRVQSDMTLYAGWTDLFSDSFDGDGFYVWNNETADDYDKGYDIVVDSEGNVFVAGYSVEGVNALTENDMAIWKFDRSGTLDTDFGNGGIVFRDGGYDTAYPNGDSAKAIALDSAGGVYAAGNSFLGLVYSCTWKHTAAGDLDNGFSGDGIEVSTVGNPGGSHAWAEDLAIGIDGNIYVTGRYQNASGPDQNRDDMFLVKYSPAGNIDADNFDTSGWVKQNVSGSDETSSFDCGYAIAVDDDGSIFIAGNTGDGASNYDMILWKYDSGGSLDLSFDDDGYVTYDNGINTASANDLVIAPDGNIYIAGTIDNGNDIDMAVWKYNNSGSPVSSFGSGGVLISNGAAGAVDGDDYGRAIVIDNDGNLYICGSSYNDETTATLDMTIWKYDSSGNPVTSFDEDGIVSHNGAASGGANNDDMGLGIALDSAGNIYVCGESYTAGTTDMIVWKYNSSGLLMKD